MITLTGMLIGAGLFWYSTLLHTKKIKSKKDPKIVIDLFIGWIMLCFFPIAICLQSTFFGYVVFAALFSLLGFRIIFFGLGIGLFWESDDEMAKSFFVSFNILLVFITIRACGINSYYLKPFVSPICIFGTNIMFLSLLVMSSRYYYYRH